ncbi:MAG: hypothetical protein ACOZBZ_04895 [Patescibacteria group bacterium]
MAGIETLCSKQEIQNGGLPVPHLPILETAGLIDAMGENWGIPQGAREPRELIKPWLEFCNNVIEGRKIIRCFRRRGELKLDFVALGAWNYAKRVLGGNFKERTEQIKAAKRAFSVLLGKKERKGMRPEDPNEARKLVSVFEERLLTRMTI